MINLILSLLRLRFLITLGIIYFLLSAATHSNFSLQLPSFSEASIDNLNNAIMGLLNSNNQTKNSTKNVANKTGNNSNTLQSITGEVKKLINQDNTQK